MESGVGIYILVSVVALLCCIVPIFRNALEMYKTYEGVVTDEDVNDGDEEDGANLFQVSNASLIVFMTHCMVLDQHVEQKYNNAVVSTTCHPL